MRMGEYLSLLATPTMAPPPKGCPPTPLFPKMELLLPVWPVTPGFWPPPRLPLCPTPGPWLKPDCPAAPGSGMTNGEPPAPVCPAAEVWLPKPAPDCCGDNCSPAAPVLTPWSLPDAPLDEPCP